MLIVSNSRHHSTRVIVHVLRTVLIETPYLCPSSLAIIGCPTYLSLVADILGHGLTLSDGFSPCGVVCKEEKLSGVKRSVCKIYRKGRHFSALHIFVLVC